MSDIFISTTTFGLYDASPLETLKGHDIHYEINPLGRVLTEEEISKYLELKDGVIAGTEPLTEKVFASNRKLRVISRVGVGVDNIDLVSAKVRNIKVYNTPEGATQAVAELTIGLILNLLRFIGKSDRNIRNNVWNKEMGNLLYGKSVGIVGFGRIGKKVAELISVFHCKVVYYDPFVENSQIERANSLDDLLSNSDIITLHIPYTESNHHLINKDRLAMIRSNAILINASRGGLVDEKALCECLKSKRIAGAALDTFEHEPYKGELAQFDNVILTPHIGSYAIESRIQMEMDAVANLIKGFSIID